MPEFKTEVPHQLGQEAAVNRLRGFVEQLRQRYAKEISEIEGGWSENVLDYSLKAFGIKIDGTLTVGENLVTMRGKLPVAALVFKGRITEQIRAALEKALAA